MKFHTRMMPGLAFDRGEFAGIKLRIADGFPYPGELDGTTVS
jgi:hypothetical protein